MKTIDLQAFLDVELRVGRVLRAEHFAAARKPALLLDIDFGPGIGVLTASAQITDHYTPESLPGQLVVAVVNLPPRQIGPRLSRCLVTGFHDADGKVRLCRPDAEVPLGTRLL